MAGLKFDITGDNGNMLSALQGVQDGVKQTQKIVEQSGHSVDQLFGKMGASASDTASSIGKATEAVSKHSEALKNDVELQNIAKQSSKELKESLKLYEKAVKEIQTALDGANYDEKIKKATESIEKQKEKLAGYKSALSDLSKEGDATGQGSNYYNSLIRNAQERIDALTSSVDGWRSKQNALNSDMERYNMLIDAANARLNGQSFQGTSAGGASQAQSLSELNTKLSESQSKLQQLESEVAKFNGTPILSDSQKAKVIDLNVEIEKTKEEIKSLKSQIAEQRGGTFFGSMRNVIDGFGDKITEAKEKVKEFISEHTRLNEVKEKIGSNPGVQRFQAEYTQAKGVVSDFSQRVENLLTGNGKLQQSFSAMGTAISGMGLPLKGVGSGIANVTKALWAMCATPVGAVITVIVMGLASMYKYLTKSAEGQKALAQISAFLGSLLSSLTDIVVTLGKFLFHAFADASGPMNGFAKSMATTFTSAIKTVGELIGGLGTAIKGIFKMDWNAFSDGMGKIWNGIKDGGKTALSAIDTAFKGAIGSVKLIHSAFTDDRLGKELGAAFGGIISKANKSADLAKRTTEATIAAGKAQEQAAKLDIQIAENREKIYKLTGKAKDALIEETKILQKQRYDSILDAQKKQLDIQREKIRLHTSSLEDLAKERQLSIDVLRTTAEQASSTRMLTRMQESNRRKMEREAKSTSKKKASSAEAAASANGRFDEVAYTNANEREKLILDLENKLIDARIAAMEDGAKRTSAERERQHKKELEEIEKQRKAALEAERKRQKAEFDAEQAIVKARGGKVSVWNNNMFDDKTEDVKKINSLFGSLKGETNKAFARKELEEQTQALYEYLKKYGTVQEQMYAIAKEYDEKITKEQDENRKKMLEAEKRNALAKADANSMALDIDWSTAFSGVGNVLKDVAKETLKEVEAYMQTAEFKALSPESKKAYTDLRSNLRKDGAGEAVSPFNFGIWDTISIQVKGYQEAVKTLKEKTAAHTRAVEDLKAAEKELSEATGDAAKNIAQSKVDTAKAKVDETGTEQKNAKSNVDSSKQNLTDSTNAAAQGINNFASALNEMNNGSLYGFANGITKLISSIAGTSKSLSELGGKVGGIIGAILQIIDALGDDPSAFIGNLLDKVISAVDTILDQLASGELIEVILKGVANLLETIVEHMYLDPINAITGGKLSFNHSNEKEVKETTDRLTKSNGYLKSSIDKLKESIDKSSGTKAIDSYKEAYKNQEAYNKNQMGILRAQMGYHSRHHSNAYYWNLSGDDYAAINDTLRKYMRDNPTIKTAKDSVGSLEDIYQLTPEQMKAISTEQVGIWQKMLEQGKYDKSEYWEKYVELAGKLEELTEKINENLTKTTFSSLHDNFVSTIMDMDATASDFADDFTEMMAKAWTNAAVGNLMDADLKKFYDKWANKMQDKDGSVADLSKTEIDELRAEYQGLTDKALKLRDMMMEATGYTGKNEQQKATANGISSITYEQATNIVALTTAGNISRDQIKDLVASIIANFSSTIALSSSTNTAVLEIRNLMIYNNSYLEDILKCSKNIYADFSRKIDDVNKNLKDLK